MPTRFTPPTGCANSWTWEPYSYNWVKPSGLLIQNCETVVSSCFPSGFANVGRTAATQVYNPGACPVGYTSAFVAVGDQVTTAVCCYSNFVYTTTEASYSDGPPSMYAGCTSYLPEKSSTFVFARGARADLDVQITGSMIMWAQPITIEFVDSDLSRLGIKYATGTSTSNPTATALTTDTSASQQSNTASSTTSEPSQTSLTFVNINTSQTSSGAQGSVRNPSSTPSAGLFLSTGAKAGIGVGAGIGAILISVFLFLWVSRHRKAKANAATIYVAPGGHLPYYCNTEGLRGGFPARAGNMKQARGPPMELDNGDYSNYSGKYLPELHG
ncbi:uncharacterized protein Aud_009672 [Aspergillus udagawae]|uniref:Carcinoembryonic antigen-related cell adhesion molecule 1 n=1 Tax=Aspergillus udagawae TaxID=91492 RepID=A0A8E0V472_9EURO|nr:uncharacterized protein Aud_009672 [Aspergillus udagawae]GIC93190.1 hypothetical protein Aud_009672 [Aspergillus udagawae]